MKKNVIGNETTRVTTTTSRTANAKLAT